MTPLTEDQIRAIRTIVHGDPDMPVVLHTDDGSAATPPRSRMVGEAEEQTVTEEDPVADHPQEQALGQLAPGGGAQLNPEAVLQECRQIDERLVELAMQRVYSRMLQQQNEALQRALQETAAGGRGEDGS